MVRKKIIAFTGKIASGKGRAIEHIISRYGLPEIEYKLALKETFELFNIQASREMYQKLSRFLRETYGQDVIERAILKKIRQSYSHAILLGGLRRPSDFDRLKKLFDFYLVYIDSPVKQRYEWMRARLRDAGDAEMTYDTFLIKDQDEAEREIESLKTVADFVIENTGTEQELFKKIDAILDPLLSTS